VARFYDIDDANERLTELRPLLESLRSDRDAIADAQAELARFRATNGNTQHATELRERQDGIREIVRRMEQAVARIEGWGVTLRDIQSGLIDFPALANGRPIWLCWRLGESDIEWWHEQDDGFGGRRPLAELI
jgi:hypothetical protein